MDTIFKASNYNEDENDENPSSELCRYEFIEILVRMAKMRFLDRRQAGDLEEALEMLLREQVFELYRDEDLYKFRRT